MIYITRILLLLYAMLIDLTQIFPEGYIRVQLIPAVPSYRTSF